MSSKYIVVLLISFIICLGVPASSQRQQPSGSSGSLTQPRGMSEQRIDRAIDTLQRTLDLSSTQATSIRQLVQTRRESLRPMREEARPKFEHLMSLLRQPNPDPATVGRAVLDLKASHEQLREKQADFEKQLDNILTPKQQQTVNTLRSQAQTFTALRTLGFIGVQESRRGMFMSEVR
jgi:Spy/CpxP family protein refolding chaperone